MGTLEGKMRLRNPKDLDRRLKELTFFVAGHGYLYIEFCEQCGWPFTLPIKAPGRKYTKCEDCRKQIIEERNWQKKVARVQKRLGLETTLRNSLL